MTELNMDQIKSFYKLATDEDAVSKEKLENFLANLPNEGDRTGLNILAKIAKTTDIDSFITMVTENELPPIDLSAEEMELLMGGGVGWWIGYIAGRAQRSYEQ